jgi:hypothetical protein
MSKEEMAALLKPITDALASLMSKVEALTQTSEPKPAESGEMESEINKVKEEYEAKLKAEQEKVLKFESDRQVAFVDGLVKSGRIKPEQKENVVSTFESMIKGGSTFEQASESINSIVGEALQYHTSVSTGESYSRVGDSGIFVIDETDHDMNGGK